METVEVLRHIRKEISEIQLTSWDYDNKLYDVDGQTVQLKAIRIIDNVCDELMKASVTPKEKMAEWYGVDGCQGACEGYMSAGVICSQCGEVFCGYIGDYDFCPNCGARMEVKE